MSTQKFSDPKVAASNPGKTAEQVKVTTNTSKNKSFQGLPFLFDKQNYIWMAIGLAVIIVGYAMMSGGRSADPNAFDGDGLYSFRRITLAPILILVGLVIEAYAIMKKPSANG
jgi:hypothetical protein